MNRVRWLCILLATLCCPIALTTSAAAECAWVLWGQAPNPSYPREGLLLLAFPLGAWTQRNECERDRARREALPKEPPAPDRPTPSVFFVCLPDTVDPRGPKAK